MRVYYEETYGKYYDIDTSKSDEATKELDYRIREGKENGPEECIGSVTVPLIGNGNPQYQIMGKKIDSMDDNTKEFYLWHLLRFYYADKLRREKEEYKDSHDLIDRLLTNVNEIDTLICYDLF